MGFPIEGFYVGKPIKYLWIMVGPFTSNYFYPFIHFLDCHNFILLEKNLVQCFFIVFSNAPKNGINSFHATGLFLHPYFGGTKRGQ